MTIEWFKGKRVTVMGLGFHGGGLGVVRWLSELGAEVCVTDLGDEERLKDSLSQISDLNLRLVLGEHQEHDFTQADMVVRNPAIPAESPFLKLARESRVPVEMESSLFMRFSPTRNLVAITGTKGKSSTAQLMFHILNYAGRKVQLAGNMGKSMVGLIDQLSSEDWLVLELSSFQCEGFAEHIEEFREKELGPKFAILTNLFEDHLNRYSSMELYAEAKKQLFLAQSSSQYSVLRKDEEWSEFFTSGLFSQVKSVVVGGQEMSNYPHVGNAALAAECAKIIGVSDQDISKALKSFAPLEHRLELVRVLNGVEFYNDSTATNPTAAVSGIRRLNKQGKKLVAILGGNDKNMDFGELVQTVSDLNIKYVLLQGTADAKLRDLPEQLAIGSFSDYREAIKSAYREALPEGIVLLSPGATSFNLFKDEFDRGRQFKEIVNSL